MTRVRILPVLLVLGALVIGAGTLDAADRAPARHLGGAAAQPASTRVPKLVTPRRAAGLHMTFPRTWRAVALEVGSPQPRPPLRVLCATCSPGTVLEVDL